MPKRNNNNKTIKHFFWKRYFRMEKCNFRLSTHFHMQGNFSIEGFIASIALCTNPNYPSALSNVSFASPFSPTICSIRSERNQVCKTRAFRNDRSSIFLSVSLRTEARFLFAHPLRGVSRDDFHDRLLVSRRGKKKLFAKFCASCVCTCMRANDRMTEADNVASLPPSVRVSHACRFAGVGNF